MKYFDLHCDTAGECSDTGEELMSNGRHIAFDRVPFEEYSQLFAVWMPDELRGAQAAESFDAVADYYDLQLEKNAEKLAASKIRPILTVEGGSVLCGDVGRLDYLYGRGVRLMTLTWNAKNELASGCFETGGLTDVGREAILEMNRLGIAVDVSHLNQQGFWQVVELSKAPIVASHSNLDIVNNRVARRRNLSEEQAKAIIGSKGVIGLNFCHDFIQNEGEGAFEAVYNQIEALLKLGGEKAICMGSDFDGCTIAEELAGIEKIPALHEYLQGRGLDNSILDDIFYNNAESYFIRVCREL